VEFQKGTLKIRSHSLPDGREGEGGGNLSILPHIVLWIIYGQSPDGNDMLVDNASSK